MAAAAVNPPIALLVASSDRSVTEALRACLNPPQYRCVLTPDGKSALEQMSQTPFRVVLAEMRLPDTNGLELLQRASAVDPRAAVILVTSYRDWELAIEAMRSGAVDCLTRPLRREQVAACIEEVGIGFMFAPKFHPAMKYAMPARRELKIRTVFNLLGPLSNPAGASVQVVGVYDAKLTGLLAQALSELGLRRGFTFCA